MKKSKENLACNAKNVVVSHHDLPLSCPMNDKALWNAHPKVFLPLNDDGTAVCPYCGTSYILKDD